MAIDRNPILNNQQYPPKTTKIIHDFGIDHSVPNRAQHVRMEGRAYYWFTYLPTWVIEGERHLWEKVGVEGINWGVCR